MSMFKSEQQQELEALSKIEKKIERRERMHRCLIAGLGGALLLSLVAHACCHGGKKHRK